MRAEIGYLILVIVVAALALSAFFVRRTRMTDHESHFRYRFRDLDDDSRR